ncbi:MAG: OmpA family protein [Burkholderiaceae bacterium]|jgi:outer membrane protein OmpA-like peptidoglycan-associated protein|nr:OmpA family protein [Burkholderiaceae bacterium]
MKRIAVGKKTTDEGEKPFWISFSDMMTTLMVLFLLVMSVALLAVTKNVSDMEQKKADREQEINQLLTQMETVAQHHPGVRINRTRHVIDFGDRVRFDSGSSRLSDKQAKYLRAFLPEILALTKQNPGQRWLKRVVVEGFADQRGDYLLNLNLSLQRSQRVLCVLLEKADADEKPLGTDELEQVRRLFLVGGYSFNSAKKSLEESRRVELRLEYFDVDEIRPDDRDIPHGDIGFCRI